MRGLALFWALALSAAVLGWLDAVALSQGQSHDGQVALSALSRKRLIGQDVQVTLISAMSAANGADAGEKTADAAVRVRQAAVFLESSYARQGVVMCVFFGFLSSAEEAAWLERMGSSGKPVLCPRCLAVSDSPALGSILAVGEAGNVNVSKNGLRRGAFPFASFGRPVLGALYAFGPVVGVEVFP